MPIPSAKTLALLNPVMRPITHTARMIEVLKTNKRAATQADYAAVIARYKLIWAGFSPEQKATAIEYAALISGIDPDRLSAAQAALEG